VTALAPARSYSRRVPVASPHHPLGASTYLALALFFLALAIYGSLVPFTYKPVPRDEAMLRWHNIPWLNLGIERRSDFVANILLFIPLGFLFVAALCVDRHPLFFVPAAVLVVPLLCGLAVGIEFTQIWFPPRTVSLNDIAAESAGGAIGAAVWAVAGAAVTARARAAWSALGRRELAARLLPIYLAFLVLIHVMPLDLTISPVEVWRKYKEGHIVLVPFTAPVGRMQQLSKLLWDAVYFVPLGVLLAGLRGRLQVTTGRALAFGVLVAGVLTFLKLFVWTRFSDVTDVLAGGLAVLGGWAAARAWMARRMTLPGVGMRTALFVAWAGVLAVVNWYPFDFSGDAGEWRERWSAVPLVPFTDLYFGSEYHAFDQILQKTLLFLPVGALLVRPGRSCLPALLAGFVLSVILEAGQLGLPTRYTSVTDVLIESSAAWLGCILARRLLTLLNSPRAAEGITQMYASAATH
jgi:glycopeptide antibiotics resistance protein